jgi:hypothetical protein
MSSAATKNSTKRRPASKSNATAEIHDLVNSSEAELHEAIGLADALSALLGEGDGPVRGVKRNTVAFLSNELLDRLERQHQRWDKIRAFV